MPKARSKRRKQDINKYNPNGDIRVWTIGDEGNVKVYTPEEYKRMKSCKKALATPGRTPYRLRNKRRTEDDE